MGKVRTQILTRAGGKIARLAADIPEEVRQTKQNVTQDAELIFQSHAPKGRTLRLSRGIHAVTVGDDVQVVSDARSPSDGYPYTGVTRFGHRKMEIKPVRRGFSASVISTGRTRGRGRRAALRFEIGGALLFRSGVRGYKPVSDWVEGAVPEVRAVARREVVLLRDRFRRKTQ